MQTKEQRHLFYLNNKERLLKEQKTYRLNNLERDRKTKSDYYHSHKEKTLKDIQRWISENPEKRKISANRYYHLHKDEVKLRIKTLFRPRINLYFKNRLKNDIEFKIRKYLRSRLTKAIKRNTQTGSAVQDLGCSISQLKIYIENQFQEGMTWDNWNLYTWHIDHRLPLDSFDLQNRKELLKACHYTNLQPMWAFDNLSKGSKLNWSPSPSRNQ